MSINNGHHDSPYSGVVDPILHNQRLSAVHNFQQLQRAFLSGLVDPRRSIEDECGFPPLGSQIDAHLYRMLYDRDPIANRAVRVMAEEAFQVSPVVYDNDQEGEEPSEFEKAIKRLGQKLGRDGKSYYKDDEGSVINEYLKRGAILSRIGRFGVILLGINDGRNLQEPVAGVVTINHNGEQIVHNAFSHGFNDSPPVTEDGSYQTEFTVENVNWQWQNQDGTPADDRTAVVNEMSHLLNTADNNSLVPLLKQLLNRRPPRLTRIATSEKVPYTPSWYEQRVTTNAAQLIANHHQLEQEYQQSLTCNQAINIHRHRIHAEAVAITNQRQEVLNAKQRANPGNRPTGPTTKTAFTLGGTANPNDSAPPSPALGTVASAGVSGAGTAPPPGAFISGTDQQYTPHRPGEVNVPPKAKNLGSGPSPSNSWQGQTQGAQSPDTGLGMPPAALSGTDQQYFGVQYGPSERLADDPLGGGAGGPLDLVFLRCYSEDLVQIVRFEWNIFNPRFGLPVMYRITLNDPRDMTSGGVGLPLATVFVHWSRVVHLAFERNSSEIFSPPALQAILNNILSLHKLYGAGPEGYWKSCFTGLSFETNPQLGGDVLIDVPQLMKTYQDYENHLSRALFTSGMTVKTLAPSVIDPGGQIDKQIEAIAIQKQMPMRVLKGSERGELASSQDDEKWNDRVHAYCLTELNPHLIFPFYDRLIQLGILPEPGRPEPEKKGKKGGKVSNAGAAAPTSGAAPPPKVNPFTAPPKPEPDPSVRDVGNPASTGGQAGGPKQSKSAGGAAAGVPATSSAPTPPGGAKPPLPGKAGGSPANTPPKPAAKPPGTPGGPASKVGSSSLFPQGQSDDEESDDHTHTPLGDTTPVDPEDEEEDEPGPEDRGYRVEWPSMDSQSASDKATVALTKTQAITNYGSQGGEQVYPRQHWLTKVMGEDEESAQAIMDEAADQESTQQQQAASLAEQHDMDPAPPPGFQNKPPPPPPPGPGMPGGPPPSPVKVGAGQSLVHPESGATIAKGPPQPKPPGGK